METWKGTVDIRTMITAMYAFHLASYVEDAIQDRGGLLLVAPPGQVKSTILLSLDDNYHNATTVSNVSRGTLNRMQSKFHNGTIRSVVFPEMAGLYAGDPRTGTRIEDYLMQLTAEATRGASVQDDPNSSAKYRGRCTVFGAMTYEFHQKHMPDWQEKGFARRFVWSYFNMENPELLNEAAVMWTKVDFGGVTPPEIPGNGSIPMLLSNKERRRILSWLRYQPDDPNHAIRVHLLSRAASVLRWQARQKRRTDTAMETMKEFAETLQKQAPLLIVKNPFPDE